MVFPSNYDLDTPMTNPIEAPAAPLQESPISLPTKSHRLKPSSPPEFSGDRTEGRAFLTSCELYMRLVPDQFPSEQQKIKWVWSFMKSGRAVYHVQNFLRHETRTGTPKFRTYMEFRQFFQKEFFQKDEVQQAIAWLESNEYFQGTRALEENSKS